MKLKSGIVIDQRESEYIAVATGEAARSFNGLIRNNKTADFILKELMSDRTEDELIAAITAKYDVDESRARLDVKRIINTLKEVNLLDY